MSRRIFVTVCVSLLALLTAWTRPAPAAESPQEDKIRVLVVTGGHDYDEQEFQDLFASIPDITTRWATYPDAAALLRPELAEDTDVIVFYDMWVPGLSPEQQQAFVQLLEGGIGVVALHHTLAAHQQWPVYAKLIGGKFHLEERVVDGQTLPRSGYDHDQEIAVQIANTDHPITRGLTDFQIHDETYCRYDTDPEATILLTTEHPKSDRELAWAKQYGRTRAVYVQLGHDRLAYENPHYRTIVARSIRWTAGRPADPAAAATPLFNGKDLAGWQAEGDAVWEVENGVLIGRQGPGNAPGDLFTTETFDDFELTVTYRVVWPANSGIWYRYQSGEQTLQADILEYENPFALSGSLYRPGLPGRPFIAINTDASIIDREGWNTLVVRAVGDRHVIFLNGTKTADVRDDVSDCGRIGFQIHPGDEFAPMRIMVRDVMIRQL